MDEATYSGIVQSIYDSALDARLWPHTLEQIADGLAGGPAALLFQDQITMLGTGATVRLAPEALAAYYQYYGRRNPLMANNDLSKLGTASPVTLDEEVLGKSEFMATEFYNDFYKPNDMHGALMITAGGRGQSLATINVMRSERQPAFDAQDIELARSLQLHLARAFQIALRLADSARANSTLIEIMDRSPHGLFLIGAAGQVVRSNAAGLAMLGDGLTIVAGELTASAPAVALRLPHLIAQARGELGSVRPGGALALPRPSGRKPLSVVVTPLGHDRADLFDPGSSVLVSVTDPEASPAPPLSAAAQLFGLTPAELRIAERLMLGDGPELAANALGVSVSTVRWHLASLYRKTGTGRQAELVRLLLSLPRN